MKTTPVSALMVFVVLASSLHHQTGHAQQSDQSRAPALNARPLSATQLTAIRSVGRHVLAAKKSGAEDGEDAAQLTKLRASLDALIAAELDPKNRTPITVQGQESSEQSRTRAAVAKLRESARSDGQAVVSQLRQ